MTDICIYHLCGAPNAPNTKSCQQTHLGIFNDQHLLEKNLIMFFAPNIQKGLLGCRMTNTAFWGTKSAKIRTKMPKNKNIVLPANASQSHSEVSNDQNVHIFGTVPNYLPHATTNTAAYKCICLFCNTFVLSGKTV